MSKYVKVTVSASASTEFYIEVPNDADEAKIREMAEKEVTLPHNYPSIIDKYLKEMGINVRGMDSMLKAWNIDEVEYVIDDFSDSEDFTDNELEL